MKVREMPQLFLRVTPELKTRIEDIAKRNRRSLSAELNLLIEDGIKWREIAESHQK